MTIEDLEKILVANDSRKVEVKPDGSVYVYDDDEPKLQGPIRIATLNQVLADSY